MKCFRLAVALFLISNWSQAAEVKVSDTEPLVAEVPSGWQAVPEQTPNSLFPLGTYRLSPPGDRNALCAISILDKNKENFKDPEILKKFLLLDCRPYISSVAEMEKIDPKPISISGGLAFLANFTDPDLVGKPIQKGNCKIATPLILALGSDYLIKVTILCDDIDGPDYKEALEIIKSIQIKK